MSRQSDTPAHGDLQARIHSLDVAGVHESLDEWGYALTPRLLDDAQCDALAARYDDDSAFRATVSLDRHRFGSGEYRYFADPVPGTVATLRRVLYRMLFGIANSWAERLSLPADFPDSFEAYRARCHAAGQDRATPLLLRYGRDGYNCLHQDRYGDLYFPLQVAFMLSEPGRDFRGGEFLLVEQRPRMQSRAEAIPIERGQGIIFPSQVRPVHGARGSYRVQVRHGVSRIREGCRMTLGIIFHDAA